MNWFETIQKKINQPDDSRELKNGEVKRMLIEGFSIEIPEFVFISYKSGCYYFERVRKYGQRPIYEIFHVGFSLKEKNFYCSVSSCFDKAYAFGNSYNIGPLNPHKDLITIVKNTGVINIGEAYYFHNGKLNTTRTVIDKIIQDYKGYGVKYLDNRFKIIGDNKLLNAGFEYISKLKVNPDKLKKELENNLKEAKYQVSLIKHPQYIELKGMLTGIKYGEKGERQYIPKLSYELLEYYCHTEEIDLMV